MPDCASRVSPSFTGVMTTEMYHFKRGRRCCGGEYSHQFLLDSEEETHALASWKNESNWLIKIFWIIDSYHIYNAQGCFSKKPPHYLLSRQIEIWYPLLSPFILFSQWCLQLFKVCSGLPLCPQVLLCTKDMMKYFILKKYGTNSSLRIFIF